ncbi:hypothetical protein HELRODRAFT_184702, partial [Helobdella robusta]|uniref:Uncharacterized protein n=1 Tax=Helobdella robusta TaxID=6412 RepID=T1FLT2_HELRO
MCTVQFRNFVYMEVAMFNESHRAPVPSTVLFDLSVEGGVKRSSGIVSHKLDVSKGIYTKTHEYRNFMIHKRIYAHREIPNLLVAEIDCVRIRADVGMPTIKLNLTKWQDSGEIMFEKEPNILPNTSLKVGRSLAPETVGMVDVDLKLFVMYDHLPKTLKPSKKML